MTEPKAEGPRPWWEVLDELRGDVSRDDVAHDARKHGARSTLSGSVLSKVILGYTSPGAKGALPTQSGMFEGLAGALGVEPSVFIEYRLAMARRLLEERDVGLDEALRNLERIDEGVEGGLLDLAGPPSDEGARPARREARRSQAGSARRKRKSA